MAFTLVTYVCRAVRALRVLRFCARLTWFFICTLMQAFARAVEAGVPIEAATVMVLLFALTRAQQTQLAEAVFCTAFGMFANMQPLLSAPWPSDSPTSAQNLAGDPWPRREFSSGLRSPKGSGSARPEDQSVQNLFSYPGATDGPDADQCCMEAQVAALGLGEGPASSVPPSIAFTSVPASCADSTCPSAAAKTSADPPAEDSPQALLARVLDLYQLHMENHANAKRAGVHLWLSSHCNLLLLCAWCVHLATQL